MAGRSVVIPVAIVVVAAAGLLTFWSQRSAPPPAAEAAAVSEHARPTPRSFSATPALVPVSQKVQPKRLTPSEAMVALDTEAKRLTELARYPRWSQPLKLLGDALAEQDTMHIQSSDEDLGQPVLTVYTNHRTYEAPEPVQIHAHLATPDGPVFTNLTGNVVDGTGQPLAQLQFSRDGLEYVATFVPPAGASATNGYSIRVAANGPNDVQRHALIEIMYNQPYAHLTGNFRDRVDNGDLVIEAEVSVQRAGQFRVNGSLYGAAEHQQIAWADAGAKLEAGTSWIPLKFHGLILREQQVDGPYLLHYVSLTTQTADAEAGMRPLRDAYTTQPYVADAFEGEAQQDAQWLGEADQLRQHMRHLHEEFAAELPPGAHDGAG